MATTSSDVGSGPRGRQFKSARPDKKPLDHTSDPEVLLSKNLQLTYRFISGKAFK